MAFQVKFNDEKNDLESIGSWNGSLDIETGKISTSWILT